MGDLQVLKMLNAKSSCDSLLHEWSTSPKIFHGLSLAQPQKFMHKNSVYSKFWQSVKYYIIKNKSLYGNPFYSVIYNTDNSSYYTLCNKIMRNIKCEYMKYYIP